MAQLTTLPAGKPLIGRWVRLDLLSEEDGTFRDSAIFSVLKSEWPNVKAGLERRLG